MKILVIGDAMVDEYLYGEINRMSPEDSSVPVVDMPDGLLMQSRPGGCLNVAENLKALGATVCVSSIMPLGEFTELRSEYCTAGYPLIKQRIINRKTGKQIVRLDFNRVHVSHEISEYKNFIHERTFLNEFDAIVVSDYDKGVVDEYWINRLANTEKWVFVDTKKPDLSIWDKIPNCIIKINEKEYRASNKTAKHPLIVTHGSEKVMLYNKPGLPVWHPVQKVENPDVVGAGDVFLSALTVCYMETKNLNRAIHYAISAATLSVKKPGTCTVAKEEVEQDVHWEDVYDKYL